VLAGERVRVTYQLCKLVMSDLSNEGIRFKLGQVMELHEVVEQLEKKLAEAITG
jgi:predicted Fe-Mo cluster-binding NifX family protein